jgi:hypothetical protein
MGTGVSLSQRYQKKPFMLSHKGLHILPAASYSPTPSGGSTIGATGLNCRVRNGNGCFPRAIATGKFFPGAVEIFLESGLLLLVAGGALVTPTALQDFIFKDRSSL